MGDKYYYSEDILVVLIDNTKYHSYQSNDDCDDAKRYLNNYEILVGFLYIFFGLSLSREDIFYD